jgi:hypothetical protein
MIEGLSPGFSLVVLKQVINIFVSWWFLPIGEVYVFDVQRLVLRQLHYNSSDWSSWSQARWGKVLVFQGLIVVAKLEIKWRFSFFILGFSQVYIVVLIIKFIVVIIVARGALTNLLAIGVESSHNLLHVYIYRCVIHHIVVIVYRPSMTTQTFGVSFVTAVKLTFTKGFPIFVFENLRRILIEVILFNSFLNKIC